MTQWAGVNPHELLAVIEAAGIRDVPTTVAAAEVTSKSLDAIAAWSGLDVLRPGEIVVRDHTGRFHAYPAETFARLFGPFHPVPTIPSPVPVVGVALGAVPPVWAAASAFAAAQHLPVEVDEIPGVVRSLRDACTAVLGESPSQIGASA